VQVTVANMGDRPIQVGSHYHFFEANKALAFDRGRTWGLHHHLPARLDLGPAPRVRGGRRALPRERWADRQDVVSVPCGRMSATPPLARVPITLF